MIIAFISDLHLNPGFPHSARLFERFLISARLHVSRLYILGDLFDYWVGDDGGNTLGHRHVEDALRSTVEAGTEVLFLPGNRDFLVGDDFAERTGCQLLPDPTVIEPDGLRILLTHGDSLCTDDVEHQEARRQMLSDKWKLAFLEQPLNQRLESAAAMRSESERSKRRKSMDIMDVNQSAVETMMCLHGVHIMIHGHTHRAGAHEFQLNGSLARRYVLGDWSEKSSVILLEDGKLTLRGRCVDRNHLPTDDT